MILKMKQIRRSPFQELRSYCHYCVQSRKDSEIENCTGYIVFATGKPCPFYTYRMGGKRFPVKIMRQFCLDCMGGSREAVRECAIKDCHVHPFRFGKNPALARKGKSREEMVHLSALRRPSVKQISFNFERSNNRQ